MIIYCGNDGNVASVPSSIPFGSSLQEVTVIIPRMVATVTLKVKPPNAEYLRPISGAPTFSDSGVVVFVAKLPKNVTTLHGRADYQVEVITPEGEVIPYEMGSFNVTRGVLVNMPKTEEELSEYSLETLFTMLSNVTLLYEKIKTIEDLIGIGTELKTAAKTLIGAINEIYTNGVTITDEQKEEIITDLLSRLPIAEEVSV